MLKINNSTIDLVEGDITELSADAIVNPANAQLILGGGVAGAIKNKGGVSIQKECDQIGTIKVGQAVITTAGDLKAKHVIHAVGPMTGEGNEDNKLINATFNSLRLAEEHKLQSLAFPAISTGIFGYPVDLCAKIMLKTTVDFLKSKDLGLQVIFCLYDYAAFDVFEQELESIL
ncbi:MAG: macro domain-containing protein [Planctomycetota bacterium]|jgi:O-acetyl-ADP-ribose deacetylase (regulator of RNase III)